MPFHWSTDPQGQRYQLLLFDDATGSDPAWYLSRWTADPTWLFERDLNSHEYSWAVEIDGGNSGEGRSFWQEVSMGPPKSSSQ